VGTHLVEGILHFVKVGPFVEVTGQQLGQQGFGHICHAAQDEADEDLENRGPCKLDILLTLLAISKGHQEQQQHQTGTQAARHRFLQKQSIQSKAACLLQLLLYDLMPSLQVHMPKHQQAGGMLYCKQCKHSSQCVAVIYVLTRV